MPQDKDPLDLNEVRRAIRTKDNSLVNRLTKTAKRSLGKIWGSIPEAVVECSNKWSRSPNEWAYGRDFLLSIIEAKVDPKKVSVSLLQDALQYHPEALKAAVDYTGHGICAGAFRVTPSIDGFDPFVSVKLERGNGRLISKGHLGLGVELHFSNADLRPYNWRSVAREFEKSLNKVPLSGSKAWVGVRVRANKHSAGRCILEAWHHYNLPMHCVITQRLIYSVNGTED